MSDHCGTWTQRLSTSLYFEKCCWRGRDQAWVCELEVRMCFCPTSEDTHSPSHANTQVAFNSRSPVPTTLLSVFDFFVFFSDFQSFCFPASYLTVMVMFLSIELMFLMKASTSWVFDLGVIHICKAVAMCCLYEAHMFTFHSYYVKVGYNVWHWEIQGMPVLLPLEANLIGVEELAHHI